MIRNICKMYVIDSKPPICCYIPSRLDANTKLYQYVDDLQDCSACKTARECHSDLNVLLPLVPICPT